MEERIDIQMNKLKEENQKNYVLHPETNPKQVVFDEPLHENENQESFNKFVDKRKMTTTIDVSAYGVIADGVTDCTPILNKLLEEKSEMGITFYFPPCERDSYYRFANTIELKRDVPVVTFLGSGETTLKFETMTAFNVNIESFNIDGFALWLPQGAQSAKGIFFNDTRNYNRFDFDLFVRNCTLNEGTYVVVARGRGVTFDNCLFSNISQAIIKTAFPDVNGMWQGNDINTRGTGFRGFFVKNNRIHFCTAIIIDNEDDYQNVINFCEISGNTIEGGVSYYRGYAHNLHVQNNNHFLAYGNRNALFEFQDVDQAYIDVDVYCRNSQVEGMNSTAISRLIVVYGHYRNLKITGKLYRCQGHVITLYGGGVNFYCDLMAQESPLTDGYRFIQTADKRVNYDGFIVRGLSNSTRVNTPMIYKAPQTVFYNRRIDHVLTGPNASNVYN